MRLASAALMFGAAVLVVFAFLHFPVPVVQLKPLKPSERLPSLSDVGPDSPEPPPPTAKQVAKMQGVFGSMCQNSVRSESERRKLGFRGERIAALCDCLVGNMIENRGGHDGREGFENFGLIAGKDTAPERRALDDARYLTMIADAERACAQRREAAAGDRPQAGPPGGTATWSRPQAGQAGGADLPEEEREAARAVAEHRRAAEAGSAEARVALAEALRDGRGVGRDDAEAVGLFRAAAEQGNARGMVGLGTSLLAGRGVARDDVAAAGWISRAAERGDFRAALLLGHLHEIGRGVRRDVLRAADLYKALVDRGGGGAAEARSRLCRLRAYVQEAEKSGPRFGVCEP
jgi:hypothetical protein